MISKEPCNSIAEGIKRTEILLMDAATAIIEQFNEEIRPLVVDQYSEDDEPAINEAFSNWTDSLCKDSIICEYLYNNICLPD